jgi:hypothetical protein
LASTRIGPTVGVMPMILPSSGAPRLGSLVGGTLLGASLVAVGLAMGYLTVATPLVTTLLPAGRAASSQFAFGIWSFAMVAGGALLVAGTNRLAITVARVRSHGQDGSLLARALRDVGADVVVSTGVVPPDGQPIPAVVIGAFGVVVLHELPSRDATRRVGDFWEARTSHGWRPTEAPLEGVVRDADRVRRWLGHGDLDFVVRVHAALIAPDTSVPRSAGCAVITSDQLHAWITALPSQRSLTAARRHRLEGFVQAGVPGERKRRSR